MSSKKLLLSIVVPSLMQSKVLESLKNLIFAIKPLSKNIELLIVGPQYNSLSKEFELQLSKLIEVENNNLQILYGGTSIYSAMNIGVKNARGEYIYFCGDTDLPNLKILLDEIAAICSLKNDTFRSPIIMGKILRKDCYIKSYLPTINKFKLAFERNPSHHQAIIYPRYLFLEIGLYDENLKIIADYDFNLRLRHLLTSCDNFLSLIETSSVFCEFDNKGTSSSGHPRNYIESFKCKKKYLNGILLTIAFVVEFLAFLNANLRNLFYSKIT